MNTKEGENMEKKESSQMINSDFDYLSYWNKGLKRPLSNKEYEELLSQQQRYEQAKKDNHCQACGFANKGSVIISEKGDYAFLMHFGMWSCQKTYQRCSYCGEKKPR